MGAGSEVTARWAVGDAIVLREMWLGRVWAEIPAIIVQDGMPRLLYFPAGNVFQYAADPAGRELRLYAERWALAERTSTEHMLSFSWPEVAHAILAIWDRQWRFSRWYINLETPLRRTSVGFDFVDHCLDVVVSADRTSWRWKDEDELEEAVARGIFTSGEARAFREEGRRALRRLLDREPPFDRDWDAWRPDPVWRGL